MKVSRVRLSATQWTILSMEFSRPEYCSGQPFPSPGDLPNPGIEPRFPALQADSLPAEPQGKPKNTGEGSLSLLQGIFPTQELNWSLLHRRQSLHQLSYQGSPSSRDGVGTPGPAAAVMSVQSARLTNSDRRAGKPGQCRRPRSAMCGPVRSSRRWLSAGCVAWGQSQSGTTWGPRALPAASSAETQQVEGRGQGFGRGPPGQVSSQPTAPKPSGEGFLLSCSPGSWWGGQAPPRTLQGQSSGKS